MITNLNSLGITGRCWKLLKRTVIIKARTTRLCVTYSFISFNEITRSIWAHCYVSGQLVWYFNPCATRVSMNFVVSINNPDVQGTNLDLDRLDGSFLDPVGGFELVREVVRWIYLPGVTILANAQIKSIARLLSPRRGPLLENQSTAVMNLRNSLRVDGDCYSLLPVWKYSRIACGLMPICFDSTEFYLFTCSWLNLDGGSNETPSLVALKSSP